MAPASLTHGAIQAELGRLIANALEERASPCRVQAETYANVWAYTTIPSVQEILVLKTAKIGAELLRRDKDGNWPPQPLVVENGDLTLESIGLSIPLAAAYRTTRLAPKK
jgi:Uma2 family endonuclease